MLDINIHNALGSHFCKQCEAKFFENYMKSNLSANALEDGLLYVRI